MRTTTNARIRTRMLPEFLRGGTSHSNLCAGEKAGKANVAQLVEQLIRNEQVSGSSPLIGSW